MENPPTDGAQLASIRRIKVESKVTSFILPTEMRVD
jgi:hypothetical protein